MKKKKLALAALPLLCAAGFILSAASAAVPPAGVKLAAVQNLVINNGSEVASLDPHKVEGVPESRIILNLLEGLVTFDGQGQIIPGVAESWKNQDNLVWTFTLRENARWSNGTPVTAEDFVYSWRRLIDPATASPYASYLQTAHISNADAIINGKAAAATLGVKALDARHLQVTLSQPIPWFISMLVHSALVPVNAHAIQQWGDTWTRPEHFIGNGAYLLSDWVVNEKIVLKRNPRYWDNAHTIIEQGTFLPIDSEYSDINRYRSGDIDITNSAVPPEMFHKLREELGAQVKISPLLCTFYYEINNRKPPFDDARVRTAIKLALDRDVITQKIMGQGQLPAFSLTPPATAGAKLTPPAWSGESQTQRSQQAQTLLEQAGYTPQHPLRFTLLYNTSDQNKKQAIAAAAMWQKIPGVQVTLQNQEWKTLLETRHQGQYDVVRATWCADYNEPSTFLNMLLSSSSVNTAFYRSEAFDQLMSQALSADNASARAVKYQQAEAQLDRDSAIVPVYYRVSVRLVKPWVGGFSGKDPFDMTDLRNYYVRQR